MAQLTANRIVKAIAGLLSALDDTDVTTAKVAVLRNKATADVTDGGTAGTAQGSTFFWKNDTGMTQRVISAKFLAAVAVTADNTNNAVITLAKVDSAGANAATIATLTTNVAQGNLVAGTAYEMTQTAANIDVADGWSLRIAIAKGGTGVAIASATAQAYVQVTLEPVS